MYTVEQIKELQDNPNVIKCSNTNIKYKVAFKVNVVKKYYEEGMSANIIFEDAGFDLSVIGKHKPKSCLKRWRKLYKTRGEKSLKIENRGRKRKIKHQTLEDKVKYLETKIAYLEAENSFLAKLRGLKKE